MNTPRIYHPDNWHRRAEELRTVAAGKHHPLRETY